MLRYANPAMLSGKRHNELAWNVEKGPPPMIGRGWPGDDAKA